MIEQGLFDPLLFRHLPTDPPPPSGLQGDPQASSLFLKRDRRIRGRLEADVPLPHRAPALEWDPVEHAAHRRLEPALHERAQTLVVSESPLPDFTHSEAEGNINAQVTVEALEIGEFLGELHGATKATHAQEPSCTFGINRTFGHPSPSSLLGESRLRPKGAKALRASSIDGEATSAEIHSGLQIRCPECRAALQHVDGCTRCGVCGYSQCE